MLIDGERSFLLQSASMAHSNKRPLRIAVLLNGNLKPDQDHISGILRFAAARTNWETFLIDDHPSDRRFELTDDWRPDGIIISDYAIERGIRRDLCQSARALVAVMSPRTKSPFPGVRFASVNLDNAAIGRAAADFLVRKGFRQFGFVGAPHRRLWSETRAAAFCAEIARRKLPCRVYPLDESVTGGWGAEQRRLSDWLKALPKPCAVFASYDQRARHLLDLARLNGLSVPEQVAVLGVDNEEFLCEHTVPTLSSLAPDFESCGYRAAELLSALLSGRRTRPSSGPETFGLRGLVQRASTANWSGAARIVETARELLRCHYAADISIEDVARAAGVSRRVMEKRFHAVANTTPAEELREFRLKRVKMLLRQSDSPIKEIGYQCGFMSEIALKNLFKARFGQSMRDYRAASRTD